MLRIVLVSAVIIPPLLVLGYAIAKGRGTWRAGIVWGAVAGGTLGAIVALGCEYLLLQYLWAGQTTTLPDVLAAAVVVVALPEEAFKLLPLLWLLARGADRRRLQDALVLAVAVS